MPLLSFEAKSYLPWTQEHRLYNATVAWIKHLDSWMIEAGVEMDPHDGMSSIPLPRRPESLTFAIETGQALLAAVLARSNGATEEESYAVLREHLPDAGLES